MESKVIPLYKYEIDYKHGEVNEYDVIIVSDDIKCLIDAIVARELVDPMKDAAKYMSITDFLIVEDNKNMLLFDINEQNLLVSYGYDVQEQYWSNAFKGERPESVAVDNTILEEFSKEIMRLHNDDHFSSWIESGVLGDAIYESEYVQSGIRKAKDAQKMHECEEMDAGIRVVDYLVRGCK